MATLPPPSQPPALHPDSFCDPAGGYFAALHDPEALEEQLQEQQRQHHRWLDLRQLERQQQQCRDQMRRQQTDVRRPSDSGANRAATPSSTRPSAASLTRPGTTVESTPSHPLGTNATKASGLPGVDKVSWGKLPWRARVLDGKYSSGATKYRTVGYFATADEAAQAHGREAPALLSANLPTVHEGVRLFLSTDRRNKSGYAGVRYIDDHGNGKYRYMAIGPSGVYLGIFGCRLAAARAYALHIGTPPVRWRSLRPRGRPLLARPPHACPRRLPPGPPWRRRRWGSRSALFPAGAPYSPERAPPPPRSLPSARSSPCPGPTSSADRGTWASSPPCPAAGASAQRLRFRHRTVTPTLWWTCGALSRYRARRRPLPPAAPSGESLLLQCMSLGSPASNMGGASTIAPSILASVLALVR
jgi:hypothetical protein